MLNIVYAKNHNYTFDSIATLSVFEYDNAYYLKVASPYVDTQAKANAVDLETGALTYFESDDEVSLINATLTIDGVSPC